MDLRTFFFCAKDRLWQLSVKTPKIQSGGFDMDRNKAEKRMATAPVGRLMLQMGTPMILSMMLQAVYNIVDSRYRSRKPLIVTTNLTLDEIRHPQDTAHARIYDRLLEMCVPISCIGVSFRKETAQEKMEHLKSLIG